MANLLLFLSAEMLPSEEKSGQCVVVAIEVRSRDFEDLCELLRDFKRWLMHAAFIAADASACSGLVQSDFNAEYVLGNADPPPRLPKAASEYINRLILSHSANIVDLALRFSTKFVEFEGCHEAAKPLKKAIFRGSFEALGAMNDDRDGPSHSGWAAADIPVTRV